MRPLRFTSLLLLVLAGCGPEVSLDRSELGGETEHAAETSADDGGESTGGSFEPPPEGCVQMPSVGVDHIDPSDCTALIVPPDPTEILVRIHNRRDRPILIVNQGLHTPQAFGVTGTVGQRVVANRTSCCGQLPECAAYVDPDFEGGCVCPGIPSIPRFVAPGGWFEQSWTARVGAEISVSPDCTDLDADEPCIRTVVPPPGTYTFSALILEEEDFDPSCGCVLDERGSCTFEGEGTCDQPVGVPVEFQTADAVWDGVCGSVDIVVDG